MNAETRKRYLEHIVPWMATQGHIRLEQSHLQKLNDYFDRMGMWKVTSVEVNALSEYIAPAAVRKEASRLLKRYQGRPFEPCIDADTGLPIAGWQAAKACHEAMLANLRSLVLR